jgi:CubicO group peptidase (beta-lactamase class C family)
MPGVLLVVLLGLAGLGAWATARAVDRRRGRAAGALAAGLVLVVGGLVAVQVWARTALETSTVARSLVWLEADTGDWRRFPARTIAPSSTPLPLAPAPLPDRTLDTVTVPGRGAQPLSELLEDTETTAFLILRDEEIVLEAYPDGSSREDIHTSFSVAKSYLSTLVGIALDRGEITSLEDPVTDYVPELTDRDPRLEQVRLRHLLTMSSGLRYEETGTPWGDDARTYYAPDLRATALSVTVESPPGQEWHYNNYNLLLMGLVLERATGHPVAQYLERMLWQPMGAQFEASWSLDSTGSGFEKMESGINARAIDYARFGYLFAHEGAVGGRQVGPEAWVEQATAADTTTDPAAHYQYWWWVDATREGRFYARGNFGQYVYIDPATDVVIVRLGREAGTEHWPEILRDVADEIERLPQS